MKKFLSLVFLFLTVNVTGQIFTNGWIDFTNTQSYSRLQYYKIKITKRGVYRISADALVNAGIRADTINPAKFQLFHKGKEQYILTEGVSNNRFLPGGYIEFYAEPNDGWFDEELYESPAHQTHPRYSLFNDTATYFLTWNYSFPNKRRVDNSDNAFSSYTPSPSFIKEIFQQYKEAEYNEGPLDNIDIPDAEYRQGEGFGSLPFTKSGPIVITKNLITKNIASSGTATVNTAVFGISDDKALYIDHSIRICLNNNAVCKDTTFPGKELRKIMFTAPVGSLLETNAMSFSTNWQGTGPWDDRNQVSYISLEYPHTFNFAGETDPYHLIFIADDPQGKSRLDITNFINPGETPILYDLTNNRRIITSVNGTTIQALVPNSPVFGSGKTCFLTKEVNYITADNIRPVSTDPNRFARFTDFRYNNSEADYIIITHKSLMEGAKAYKDYREKKNGYKVSLVDIDEIYDQFGYGINKHPLSVRKFSEYVLNLWTKKPDYLLLLGKSYPSSVCRVNEVLHNKNLVPTFGSPPSDHLLTARIKTFSKLKPAIATGRLSAKSNQQIYDYLQKVTDYENAKVGEWMKNVIHLAGGNDISEQTTFKAHLAAYENIIEKIHFGGHVTTFSKNDPRPQINPSDSLRKLIEEGTSIITFFGHSSSTLMDYSLEEPENYNVTRGNYSFYITDGCYSGNVHSEQLSNSEKYVLIPDKGCIGFLGPTHLAVVDALRYFTEDLYNNISNNLYGQPVGKSIQTTAGKFEDTAEYNIYLKEVLLEMTLEGDPAIVINSPPKPDIKISKPNIFFNPPVVTTDASSFTMNIALTNIGKAITDSFFVQVRRVYPDNSDTTFSIHTGPLYYRDTLRITFPVNVLRGVGLNTFEVFADATQQIDETWAMNPGGESNNKDTAQLLIQSTGLTPVYPPKYAIIPDNSVTLKAVTGTMFSAAKDYIIEIDTTDLFNSPLKQSTTINLAGGLVSWTPSLVLKDSSVYFWRTSLAGSNIWSESSFTYIPGKSGWSQGHFFQFKNNIFKSLAYNRTQRKFGFAREVKDFRAHTIHTDSGDPLERGFYVNNLRTRFGWSKFPNLNGFTVAVFDPAVGKFWEATRGNYGQYNYNASGDLAFDFDFDDSTNTPSKFNSFLGSIPDGHFVLVYSVQNARFKSFPSYLKTTFESLGSSFIGNEPGDTLLNNDTTAYIMFCKKGSGIVREKISTHRKETITLNDSLITNWTEGLMSSEIIGPAKQWNVLKWKEHSAELPKTDKVTLTVTGITTTGVETPLLSFSPDTLSLDLSSIADAGIYPYLKLNIFSQDPTNRTPSQTDYLRIFYEPAPEATINPARLFSFYSDTLHEGDILKFSTAIENISSRDMDSLRVKAWVYDRNRIKHVIYDSKRKPLLKNGTNPNDTLIFSTTFDTRNFAGNNSIWLEINADKDQLEQNHTNNISFLPFYVKKDISNPFVDVTFDGVHILDGDIVSARPSILIKVNDENRYLPLNDTSLFKVWLLPPGVTDLSQSRVFFKGDGADGKSLRFIPGTSAKNVAEINLNPALLDDGIYTLIVEGRDVSKNESGKNHYRVNFEVINRSTITGVLNYPNPFSTSTRFVFVLTGSELPTAFKIQILTVTGKVVREIMLNELGPIHIGRNISQYAWDGKDEFGDQLANGLYIYRVIATINGSQIEKRETSADKYFVKGYGKMYLMR